LTPRSSFHTPPLQIERKATSELKPTILHITMTREGSTQFLPACIESARAEGLIEDGEPRRLLPHHIRLQPLEHRHEEEEQQDAADLA
jgi:hypothetical protein